VTRDPRATLATGPLGPDHHVAVSPHHLASSAAVELMGSGGTAVDGAVCANAVLSVVAPETCGPGGDLFALVHAPQMSAPAALNASGRAGSGATAADIRAAGYAELPPRGPWAITIPGAVDGWFALLDRFGRLELDAVFAPAIELAEHGFEVSAELADALERLRPTLIGQRSAPELYPTGRTPRPGDVIHRPALASTLRAIVSEGRAGFYEGPVADGIVAAAEGAIRPEDLRAPQAEWIEPLGADVFDRRLWTIPPNSQGYMVPATLAVFERLGSFDDPADPAFQHALIEAYRVVAAERDQVVADPTTAPIAPDDLVDPERLSALAELVAPDRAGRYAGLRQAPGGTAYLCTRDASGMGVSYIQSNFMGIGSGRSAGATGVWLHNRGAGFNLIPGHPNEYAPGRRPLHTLSPTLWTDGDRLALLLGTRGGHYQPQLLAQIAADLHVGGSCPDDSQAFPRWVVHDLAPGSTSRVEYEPRFPRRTIAGLSERGHDLVPVDGWMTGWGPVSIIRIEDDLRGSADPRVSTAAAVSRPAGTPRS